MAKRSPQSQQEGMFPEDKIKELEAQIEDNHSRVKLVLSVVTDYGKFFKLFSEYSSALDGVQADKADSLLLENVRFGFERCKQLSENLKSVDKLLIEAQDYADEIKRLKLMAGI